MTQAHIDLSCPVPFSAYERVVLAHGGGGRVMHQLIEKLFVSAFGPVAEHDGAVVDLQGPLAFTTDAFTVNPLFFPGGDIGRLAVCGTVNDIAMCGARPRYLSCAFVLEEGFPLADLARVVESMVAAANQANVSIITGDTKVVERGKGDGVYITTTGIGETVAKTPVTPAQVTTGDAVIISGPVGDHGISVMAAREHLHLTPPLASDAAPVASAVLALIEAGVRIHCLRDPTRGGLASTAAEIATASKHCVHLIEAAIPVRPTVSDCCELLGLDPLYVASEGRFLACIDPRDVDQALAILAKNGDTMAAHIGEIREAPAGIAVIRNDIGSERVLDLLSGEQLPRIC